MKAVENKKNFFHMEINFCFLAPGPDFDLCALNYYINSGCVLGVKT